MNSVPAGTDREAVQEFLGLLALEADLSGKPAVATRLLEAKASMERLESVAISATVYATYASAVTPRAVAARDDLHATLDSLAASPVSASTAEGDA